MDALIDKSVTNMITVYLAQIDLNIFIRSLIQYGDEEGISPDNLIIGLIYRLMVPKTMLSINQWIRQLQWMAQEDAEA